MNRGNEVGYLKRERKRIQQLIIKSYMNKYLSNPNGLGEIDFPLPCEITLTRIAPREYDYDNLISSFKYIVDEIAGRLIKDKPKGHSDRDKRLHWIYKQEKGKPKEYALKVEIDLTGKYVTRCSVCNEKIYCRNCNHE